MKESFEERDLAAAAAGKREEVVEVEREREVGEERRSLEMERAAAIVVFAKMRERDSL